LVSELSNDTQQEIDSRLVDIYSEVNMFRARIMKIASDRKIVGFFDHLIKALHYLENPSEGNLIDYDDEEIYWESDEEIEEGLRLEFEDSDLTDEEIEEAVTRELELEGGFENREAKVVAYGKKEIECTQRDILSAAEKYEEDETIISTLNEIMKTQLARESGEYFLSCNIIRTLAKLYTNKGLANLLDLLADDEIEFVVKYAVAVNIQHQIWNPQVEAIYIQYLRKSPAPPSGYRKNALTVISKKDVGDLSINTLEAIKQTLADDSNVGVKRQALICLEKHFYEPAIPTIIQTFSLGFPDLNEYNVYYGKNESGNHSTFRQLPESKTTFGKAILSLRSRTDAVEPLVKALNSDDEWIKFGAAVTLNSRRYPANSVKISGDDSDTIDRILGQMNECGMTTSFY